MKNPEKKGLTKIAECGNLNELLPGKTDRESKTSEKKFLTNEMKFAKIAMFRRERRVPCKLNNVTKRKHQTEMVLRNHNQKLQDLGLVNYRGL